MPPTRSQLISFLAEIGVLEAAGPEPGALPPIEPDLAPIEEALTHSSAGLAWNHERLEFLGDAVLRLAASEYLQQHHPELSVGACSELRAQIVSDRWLAELGATCGIDRVVRLGPLAIGDQAASRTIRAESCEALVGGLYEAWGNLRAVHRWLAPHWKRSIAELLADPPSPQLEIGPAGMEPGRSPGTAQLPGGGAQPAPWRSPSLPLLGGTRRQAPGRGLGGIATGV